MLLLYISFFPINHALDSRLFFRFAVVLLQKVKDGASAFRFLLDFFFGKTACLEGINLIEFFLDTSSYLKHVLIGHRSVLLLQNLVEKGWHRLALLSALVFHGKR